MINWQVYQENIGLLGIQGSGKTSKCKEFLDQIPNVPRLIVSPQNPIAHYRAYGVPISSISEIEDGRAMLWIGDFSKSTHERICKRIMDVCHNMVFVTDDVHEYCTKQKMPDNFNRLIQSGRNRGICGTYIPPAPNLVHNYILQSCHHMLAFHMSLASQIEWLEKNCFGPDAQMLIPPDRRNKKFNGAPFDADDPTKLTPTKENTGKAFSMPKYGYLYRYYQATENEVYTP